MTGNASLLYELALTARNFGPEEAVKLGLVSNVVKGSREEVTKEAIKLATLIACQSLSFALPRCVGKGEELTLDDVTAKSPIATLSTKHLLNYSREHSVQEGLDYTAVWYASRSRFLLLSFQSN